MINPTHEELWRWYEQRGQLITELENENEELQALAALVPELVEAYIELIIDSKDFKLCENCFEVIISNATCKGCKMQVLRAALAKARKLTGGESDEGTK